MGQPTVIRVGRIKDAECEICGKPRTELVLVTMPADAVVLCHLCRWELMETLQDPSRWWKPPRLKKGEVLLA